MTGSYAANKSGGVLRKNVLPISNNSGASVTTAGVCGDNHNDDEIDVCTGQFINQEANQAGIINTLNRLHIAGFQFTAAGRNGSHQYSCNSPGILSFSDGQCVDWGNPLGELYLEALRYFAGAGPTAAFDVSDATVPILSSIPKVTWSDPLPANEWCALSSIVVLSTGLNSFDTDQLASFTPSGGSAIDAVALTKTVGDEDHEDINGHSYMIGSLVGGSGTDINKQCTAKTVSDLSKAKGICPEVPSLEGGYAIAGLAYAPKTIDLRPGYAARRTARWGGAKPINLDWALRQPFNTYALQLAEALPSFSVPVGTTERVTLLPACQANSNGNPGVWTSGAANWRNCSMTNLVVDTNVAAGQVGAGATARTNTCSGNGTTSQCFTVSWEDSTWGNDYDMDGIQRLGYCVGTDCNNFKMLCPSTTNAKATIGPWTGIAAGELVIATCATQAQAGHALTFGYTVSGSTNDGPFYPILRPGGQNFNVGSLLPAAVTGANSVTFSQGDFAAGLLQNPLWYAAKYGGFTESTPEANPPNPDLTSEWDADDDGTPDNYHEVRNPAQLANALSSIFDSASQPDASAASVATNSTNLQVDTRVFQATFSSAEWSGQLLSYRIDTTPVLKVIFEWDGGVEMNAQDPTTGRTILTRGSADGVPFVYADLTVDQQGLLDTGPGRDPRMTAGRIGWTTCGAAHDREGPNGTFDCGTNTTSKFRERLTTDKSGQKVNFRLGDIVNSNPWYVGPPLANFSAQPGYEDFRRDHLGRKPVVYVGANDGMLHGFDASLQCTSGDPPCAATDPGVPTPTAGDEVLAYVPTAVFPNLTRLTAQNYNRNHRYFVDGSPMVADADLDDASATFDWRTVLVGALGGGGRGYYALDVTDPTGFSEGDAADILLWEFDETDETDMGYAFNLPPVSSVTKQAKQIVRVCTAGSNPCTSSKWAVVLGNGYNSVEGKAVLYVLFIEDGLDGEWAAGDFVKIVANAPDTGAGEINANNGLSTPVPFDSNGDGYADTVYAGDLKGNLWKFLIGPNASEAGVTGSASTWKVAFSSAGCPIRCVPLFKAQVGVAPPAQPIIWPPEVTRHPVSGQMVLFGTGKYLESADNVNADPQTLYGIWDKHDGSTIVGSRATDLLEQTMSEVTLPGGKYRVPTEKPITWRVDPSGDPANCGVSCTPTHLGWYLNLPTSKERATGIPKLIRRLIFFNTFIPSDLPCDSGGTGWLIALDWRTGGLPKFEVFDTDGSGTIDGDDTRVGGYQVGGALGGTTLIPGGGAIGIGVSSLTSGSLALNLINFGSSTWERLNWREIVQ